MASLPASLTRTVVAASAPLSSQLNLQWQEGIWFWNQVQSGTTIHFLVKNPQTKPDGTPLHRPPPPYQYEGISKEKGANSFHWRIHSAKKLLFSYNSVIYIHMLPESISASCIFPLGKYITPEPENLSPKIPLQEDLRAEYARRTEIVRRLEAAEQKASRSRETMPPPSPSPSQLVGTFSSIPQPPLPPIPKPSWPDNAE